MQSAIDPADHIHQNTKKNAVLVRPVSPDDEESLRLMLSRLSRESVHLRFHAPLPRAPEWAAAMFANSDRRYGESLVAVAGGEVIGHAMYARQDGDATAEFLFALAEKAGHEGVKRFTGAVLGENRRMFGLVRSVFERVGYAMEDGAYAVSAPLP